MGQLLTVNFCIEGTNDILRLFIALTGIQHAGGHLQELLKAMKNPAWNFGVVIGEAGKRVKRLAGLSSGPSLQDYVHADLSEPAKLVRGFEKQIFVLDQGPGQ